VCPNVNLIRAVRRALRAAADPTKAPAMQAYMKSQMPYLGVQAAPLRHEVRPLLAAHRLGSFGQWRDTVLELWRKARYREERYAAIELAGFRAYRTFQTLDALPVYEEMIVSGAWWDLVDSIASHQIGGLLRRHPVEMAALLRKWAAGEDLWKRRTAILGAARIQARYGLATPLRLDPPFARPAGIFPAERHRLGVAGVRQDRRRGSGPLREPA